MKQHYLLLLALVSSPAMAQFSAGADGLVVTSGTSVAIDGLALTPSANLDVTSRTLSLSDVPVAGAPTSSIKRVYTFNTPLTFTGTLGIMYDPLTELNGNTEANLEIAYSTSSNGFFTVSVGSTRDLIGHQASRFFNAQNLSSITATNASAVLPVTLVAFHAKKEGDAAVLSWRTATETNSDRFEIQRSRDARSWRAIGNVAVYGERQSEQQYHFTDPKPESGSGYYRLKMIDKDHSFAFSSVREVTFEEMVSYEAFPNPTVDRITIKVDDISKVSNIELTDIKGIVVIKKAHREKDHHISFDLKTLTPGAYLVRVNQTDGSFRTLKIIRQ